MNLEGLRAIHENQIDTVELYPGVRKRTLFKAGPSKGPRILVLDIDPGHRFQELDVHDTGPEEVYVLEGSFHDGAREYPKGSLIHYPRGTSHIPQSVTGCKVLVIIPEG